MSKYETKDSGERQDYPSGMRRDVQVGKPRFDLLEVDFVPYSDQLMTRVAELLDRGAVKYSQPIPVSLNQLVGLCSCENQIAILTALTTLEDSAGTAMSAIFENVTRTSQSDSERTLEPGSQLEFQIPTTKPGRQREFSHIVKAAETARLSEPGSGAGPSLDSLLTLAKNYFALRMASVQSASTSSEPEGPTSITITRQDLLEGFYAHAATKLLDSSANQWNLLSGHSSTCTLRRLKSSSGNLMLSNERNWELADSTEELDRFRGSALRHLKQWYHGETDEDHAAATVFNLLAYESIKYKLGFLAGWEDVGYLTDDGIDKTQPFAGADLVDYKAAIDQISGSMFEAYQKRGPVRRGCDVEPVFVPADDSTPLSIVDWSLPGYVKDFDVVDLTSDLSMLDESWEINVQNVSQGFLDLLFGRPLQPPTDTPIYTQLALDFDLDSVGAST